MQLIQDRWSHILMDDVHIDTMTRAFKNANYKSYSASVYQHYNQCKLLHRRTLNNKLLYKMGISPTDKCLIFTEHIDTIEHIYLSIQTTQMKSTGKYNVQLPCMYTKCTMDSFHRGTE